MMLPLPSWMRWVVRVKLSDARSARTFAYRCRGCRKGDIVEVPVPGDVVVRRVIGFGRRCYCGRLKRAKRV
jgi:hypothetical protein